VLASAAITAALSMALWHSRSLPGVDRWVLQRVAARGDHGLRVAQHVTSALTVLTVVAAVALVACASFGLRRADAAALALLSPVFSVVVERGLKSVVARREPGASAAHFPSGHVAFAAAVVLSVVLIVRAARLRRSRRVGLSLAAGVLALGMMWSRMADTAHVFTDVVAGAALGTTVTLAVALVLDHAHGRHRLRLVARV